MRPAERNNNYTLTKHDAKILQQSNFHEEGGWKELKKVARKESGKIATETLVEDEIGETGIRIKPQTSLRSLVPDKTEEWWNFLDSNFVDCICINRVISDPKDTRINASILFVGITKVFGWNFLHTQRERSLIPSLLSTEFFRPPLFRFSRCKRLPFSIWYQ